MIKRLVNTLNFYMCKKVAPKRIRSYINAKQIHKSRSLDSVDKRNIRVAVVQENVELYKSYKEYVDAMYGFIKEAVDEGSQLVCFPEENGFLVLGMVPFVETILNTISKKNKKNINNATRNIADTAYINNSTESKSKHWIFDILSSLTPFIKNTFEIVFSELSRQFGIYIMAGSVILKEDGKIFNRAYLFGPEGELVGVQDKTHLVNMELELGISTGDELKVFDTRIGRVALPICMDATYFETFKILKAKGAQIVIVPIANIEEYNYYLALRGIWSRVQESRVYGLKSALVGDLYGIRFTGKAGIYAPIGLTQDRNGTIAEAVTFDKTELIYGNIDLTLLEYYRDPYFCDKNTELYKKYFQIYRENELHN